MKKRFYCPNCKKFLDRRKVVAAEDYTMETVYFCKWCDTMVMKSSKIISAMVKDYAEYLIQKGEEEDYS